MSTGKENVIRNIYLVSYEQLRTAVMGVGVYEKLAKVGVMGRFKGQFQGQTT